MTREEMINQARAGGERRSLYENAVEPLLTEDRIGSHLSYFDAHIEEKNAEVNAAIREIKNVEAFAYFADAHVRESRFSSVHILRSILKNTPVKTVLYGGDTVSAYGDEEDIREDVEHFFRMYAFADLYPARGNHDIYGKPYEYADVGYVLSNEEVYNYIFKDLQHKVHGIEGKTYYWFDHEETRVRYIVVDTNEICIVGYHENGIWDQLGVNITNEQLAWFGEVLMSTPEDYKIIVMGHIPAVAQLAYANSIARSFGQMIEAYNAREQKHCLATEKGSSNEIDVDFRNARSQVVLYLCGHGHRDDLYCSESGCSYYEIHTDSMCDNGGSIYRKTVGEITESAVDVILYDRDSGEIKSIRYGAGINATLREADPANI